MLYQKFASTAPDIKIQTRRCVLLVYKFMWMRVRLSGFVLYRSSVLLILCRKKALFTRDYINDFFGALKVKC